MSTLAENSGHVGDYPLAIAFLALLTLADNTLANTLPIVLGPVPPQVPGYWNLTTAALVVSVVSDLIGQLVLIPLIDRYGYGHAMKINSFGVFMASVYSLISLYWGADGSAWALAIASIFKLLGGGSHTTVFLTIALIRKSTSSYSRAALIYTTGAVVVLCQTIASSVSQLPARQNPILAYLIAISCCILAGVIAIIYEPLSNQAYDGERASDPSAQPLIPLVNPDQDTPPATLWGFLGMYSRGWRMTHSGTRRVLKSLGIIFFLAAVAKATRPLFLTYIQHRVGVSAEASGLWLVRTVMSLGIFAVLLPLAVILLIKYTSALPSTIGLYTGKVSIVLLAIGALLIGLARSQPVLVLGLLINTLGVAADLALLAFAADAVTGDTASCFFMAIASLESGGTLAGIGLLYPLYQISLNDKTLFGGIPYYICAGLFAISGVIAWRIRPLLNS
ncbi:hypothetical protein F5X97DRAFT_327320 [Nemania serpens]|nr:hypothetical protein F5X97DRAFT_327320 [Nemania serpens]